MSNSIFLQTCCQNVLIAPFGLPQNSFCCDILAPVSPTANSNPVSVTCATVDCTPYSPVCFVPTGSSLCNYLAGIDTAICNLKTSLTSIPCSAITMAGPYFCVPGNPQNLCQFAASVDSTLCVLIEQFSLLTQASGSGSGTVSVTTNNNNVILDGNNGVLNVVTGLTNTNGVLSLNNTIVHGNSNNSLQVTPAIPFITTVAVTTTTPIAVVKGQVYELKGFVYSGTGSSPVGANVSIGVNGTGQSTIVKSVTTAAGNPNWDYYVTRYIPDVNQNVSVSINITNFIAAPFLQLADIAMRPMPTTNSGSWFEYEVAQIRDVQNVYGAIASNFAVSTQHTISGLFITTGPDVYVINGKYVNAAQQTFGFPANTTHYVFYDTWVDAFVSKTTSAPDVTQIPVYEVITNGSVVTTVTPLYNTAPFSGSNIQPASITGSNIALATITSSNLVNTAVTPGTYGDGTHVGQFTVNAQGQLTNATNIAIVFPVTSVNGSTGAVSLGISNMNDATITSPSNGQFLKYNGSKWVNASLTPSYYQTVYSSLVAQTQRAGLNFGGYFSLTDDNINGVTTVAIATNSLTYDRIQKVTAGNALLGNSTGATGNIQEITVSTDLLLTSGNLSVNYVINAQSGTTYNAVTTDINGATIIAMSNSGARTVNLPAANTVPVGRPVWVKDINGNASSANITVQVTGGGNIDGTSTNVINTNYGKGKYYSNGTQYYSL